MTIGDMGAEEMKWSEGPLHHELRRKETNVVVSVKVLQGRRSKLSRSELEDKAGHREGK